MIRASESSPHLNDFGVSILPFGLLLESEDRSQEAEKGSGPRDMLKRGMVEAEKITYRAGIFAGIGRR